MGVRADTGWDHRRSGSAPGLSKKLAPQIEIGPRTLQGRWSPAFREPPISLERAGAKTKIEPVLPGGSRGALGHFEHRRVKKVGAVTTPPDHETVRSSASCYLSGGPRFRLEARY